MIIFYSQGCCVNDLLIPENSRQQKKRNFPYFFDSNEKEEGCQEEQLEGENKLKYRLKTKKEMPPNTESSRKKRKF